MQARRSSTFIGRWKKKPKEPSNQVGEAFENFCGRGTTNSLAGAFEPFEANTSSRWRHCPCRSTSEHRRAPGLQLHSRDNYRRMIAPGQRGREHSHGCCVSEWACTDSLKGRLPS